MIEGGSRRDRSVKNRPFFILMWKDLEQKPTILYEDPPLVSPSFIQHG